jgi:nitric oxide reductase NorD protein
MARQPAPLRLLILVSDGYPQDTDYGPDRRSEEYGIQDTAQALREAERAGIIPFCVTIDPGGHDYLRRMCRPDRYRVIEDVESLPQALGEVYAALTARAGGPRC